MFPICRLSDQRCVIAAGIAVGFMKHKPAYSVQPSWGSFLPQRQKLRPGAAGERTCWESWCHQMYKHALYCNNKNIWDCLFYKQKRFISLHGFGSWKTQGQVVTAGGDLYCFIIWKVGGILCQESSKGHCKRGHVWDKGRCQWQQNVYFCEKTINPPWRL